MTDKPRCDTCAYFHRDHPEAGECRRRPPIVTVDADGDSLDRAAWPRVGQADWCGEHPLFAPAPLAAIFAALGASPLKDAITAEVDARISRGEPLW